MFRDCQLAPSILFKRLGIHPCTNNPLSWINEQGDEVLYFERYISPYGDSWSRDAYYRQPQLWRWIYDGGLLDNALLPFDLRLYQIEKYLADTDQMYERQDKLKMANRYPSMLI
jgi:hypothetical protein